MAHAVLRDLRGTALSLSAKVDAAENAWRTIPADRFPGKAVALFEWLAGTLVKFSSDRTTFARERGPWRLAKEILDVRSDELLSRPIRFFLLQPTAGAVLSRDNDVIGEALAVFRLLTGAYGRLFRPTLEQSVAFTTQVLDAVDAEGEAALPELLMFAEAAVDHLAAVALQQGNPRKIFSTVCSKLLWPLVRAMETASRAPGSLHDNIAKAATFLLSRALFSRDHLSEFSNAYSFSRSAAASAASYPKQLFDELSTLLSAKDGRRTAAFHALPQLLSMFILQTDRSRAAAVSLSATTGARVGRNLEQRNSSCFDFAREMLSLAGDASRWGVPELASATAVFALLSDKEVFHVANDAQSLAQLAVLRDLATKIGQLLSPGSSDDVAAATLTCLEAILPLDYDLVQPFLPQIWRAPPTAEAAGLQSRILRTYARLNLLERPVSVLVEAIIEADAAVVAVAPATLEALTAAVCAALPAQSVVLLKVLLEAMDSAFKRGESSSTTPAKKKRKTNVSAEAAADPSAASALRQLTRLLHAVLVRAQFPSESRAQVDAAVTAFRELETVSDVARLVDDAWSEAALDAHLLLCRAWSHRAAAFFNAATVTALVDLIEGREDGHALNGAALRALLVALHGAAIESVVLPTELVARASLAAVNASVASGGDAELWQIVIEYLPVLLLVPSEQAAEIALAVWRTLLRDVLLDDAWGVAARSFFRAAPLLELAPLRTQFMPAATEALSKKKDREGSLSRVLAAAARLPDGYITSEDADALLERDASGVEPRITDAWRTLVERALQAATASGHVGSTARLAAEGAAGDRAVQLAARAAAVTGDEDLVKAALGGSAAVAALRGVAEGLWDRRTAGKPALSVGKSVGKRIRAIDAAAFASLSDHADLDRADACLQLRHAEQQGRLTGAFDGAPMAGAREHLGMLLALLRTAASDPALAIKAARLVSQFSGAWQLPLPVVDAVLAVAIFVTESRSDLHEESRAVFNALVKSCSRDQLVHVCRETSQWVRELPRRASSCALLLDALLRGTSPAVRPLVIAFSGTLSSLIAAAVGRSSGAAEAAKVLSMANIVYGEPCERLTSLEVGVTLQAIGALALVPGASAASAEDAAALHDAIYALLLTLCRRHDAAVVNNATLYIDCVRSLVLCHAQGRVGGAFGAQAYAWIAGAALPRSCLEDAARLVQAVATHKKRIDKYAINILGDYVRLLEHMRLSTDAKRVLVDGVFAIMDICNEHALQQLLVSQTPAGKVFFKGLHAEYSEKHKFRGKI